jgi:hypothetical protein
MNLAIDAFIAGKIHPFQEQGILQAEMRYPAGAETVLGLARLG